MKFKRKDIVLVTSIMVAIIIAIWGVIFNHGTVVITSNVKDYTLQIGKSTIQCAQNVCITKVTPKSYKVKLSKDGYVTSEQAVEVTRSKTTKVEYLPIKMPKITALNKKPKPKFEGQLGLAASGQQFFINQKAITTFPDPLTPNAEFSISPSGKYSVVFTAKDFPQFYLIDNNNKTKSFEVLEVMDYVTHINFLDDDNLLLDMNNTAVVYNLHNGQTRTIPTLSGGSIYCYSSTDCLMISPYIPVTQNEAPDSRDSNLFSNIIQEGGLKLLENVADMDYKLYQFNPETFTFIYLMDMPEMVVTPRKIYITEVEGKDTLVIEDKGLNFFKLDR